MSSIGRSSGPQPWDTYSKTETDNLKVAKVSSTDNAIVRFDGTSGAVQNSSVVIDDSGNVGIGVTPSAWGSGQRAIQAGTFSAGGGGNGFTSNAYYNSGWKYVANGYASNIFEQNGNLLFTTAPSGTAGNAITFTTAMTLDANGNLQFNSGYGSVATAYGCRAWVNFNGTGTVAIRASGNVSSITDNGTGDYTVNFTTAMTDANYSAVFGGKIDSISSGINYTLIGVNRTSSTTQQAGSIRLNTSASNFTSYDYEIISVSIFR